MKQRLGILAFAWVVAVGTAQAAVTAPADDDRAAHREETVPAVPLDPSIRTMIEAAIQSGDFEAAKTVIHVARLAAPNSGADIDAIEAAWKIEREANDARAEAERRQRLREAGVLENWKGQVELGGSRATGTTRSFGVIAAVDGERDGLSWRHKLHAQAEFQRTDGVRTQERIIASWQPNYKFSDRGYVFGLALFERDPFAGYDTRYTAGTGLGYGVVAGPTLKLDVEGGPALRRTRSITGDDTNRVVGRGSVNLNWKITPTLQLVQTGAVYLEHGDNNATATTALDTKLIGDLKARLSYNVQYEKDTPVGTHALNTQSRATLVYTF